MSRHLFEGFHQNPRIYRLAVEYWQDLIDNLLKGNRSHWDNWFNLILKDGTEIMDGNPIISLINSNENRGLRIIQIPIDPDDLELTGWLDNFGEGKDSILHLVISCQLTRENEPVVKRILRDWFFWDSDREGFEKVLNKTLDSNTRLR